MAVQNLTLHAVQTGTTGVIETPQKIDEDILQALSVAMEDIIIESKLRSEAGPMKSAWERAVERRKQEMAMKVGRHVGLGPSQGRVFSGMVPKERPTRARSISM